MPIRRSYVLPLLFWATTLCAEERTEQRALPIELAVTDAVTMTEADESYVSTSLERFDLPDQIRWTAAVEAAYGLTDRWRIAAEIPYAFLDPHDAPSAHGIGDVEASVRYAAIDYRRNPFGLDVGLGVSLPSGDHSQDLGDGRTRWIPSLTASQWVGPINVQLGLAWARAVGGSDDEPRDEYEYDLAVVYPVRRVWLVLEGDGETAGGQTSYYVTPEVVWKASEHVEAFFAAPIGVTAAAGDYGLIAGCTIEIEHVFHRREAAN